MVTPQTAGVAAATPPVNTDGTGYTTPMGPHPPFPPLAPRTGDQQQQDGKPPAKPTIPPNPAKPQPDRRLPAITPPVGEFLFPPPELHNEAMWRLNRGIDFQLNRIPKDFAPSNYTKLPSTTDEDDGRDTLYYHGHKYNMATSRRVPRVCKNCKATATHGPDMACTATGFASFSHWRRVAEIYHLVYGTPLPGVLGTINDVFALVQGNPDLTALEVAHRIGFSGTAFPEPARDQTGRNKRGTSGGGQKKKKSRAAGLPPLAPAATTTTPVSTLKPPPNGGATSTLKPPPGGTNGGTLTNNPQPQPPQPPQHQPLLTTARQQAGQNGSGSASLDFTFGPRGQVNGIRVSQPILGGNDFVDLTGDQAEGDADANANANADAGSA